MAGESVDSSNHSQKKLMLPNLPQKREFNSSMLLTLLRPHFHAHFNILLFANAFNCNLSHIEITSNCSAMNISPKKKKLFRSFRGSLISLKKAEKKKNSKHPDERNFI